MKFLVTARWKPEVVGKAREQGTLAKLKPFKLEGKFLFPPHTVVGTNTSVCIIETNSIEDVVRFTYALTPMMTFETRPIMESNELEKFAKSADLV